MYLKNLKLYKFRSYEYLDLDFSKEINVIYGKNAQGKTNIIEAIYYFSALKSHRFVNDREIINENSESAMMKIEYFKNKGDSDLKIVLKKGAKKELLKNNCEKERTEFLGNFYSVLFSPEDLNLIKGEKEQRRRFIDIDICQLRPNYYKYLQGYNNILLNRNKILKGDEKNSEGLLEVYTKKLVEYGSEVIFYRFLYLKRLKETAERIYSEISDDKRKLEIKYKTFFEISDSENINEIKENFIKSIKETENEEKIKKTTVTGPHKDDIEFLLDGKNAKVFASQGQQRTIILALKLSEMFFIKELTGEAPVLLLDDILSELDKQRQKRLFNYVKNFQTIITVTDSHTVNPEAVKMIKIENSKVV